MADSDRQGSKPYKTYKAGRGKRRALDDELAGARPAREPKRRQPDAAAPGPARQRPARPTRATRSYGAAPATGRSDKRRRPAAAPPRTPAPLPLVARPRRALPRCWSSPASSSPSSPGPGYQKFSRSVEAANRRLDKVAGANAHVDHDVRAQLTPDNGWIWRKGTTLLLFGVDSKAGEPARSDTIMLMRFNPGTHTINQLSIPRDTLRARPRTGVDEDQRGDVLGRAVDGDQDRQAVPRHRREPRDDRQLPGLPAPRRRRRRRRPVRAQDDQHDRRQVRAGR